MPEARQEIFPGECADAHMKNNLNLFFLVLPNLFIINKLVKKNIMTCLNDTYERRVARIQSRTGAYGSGPEAVSLKDGHIRMTNEFNGFTKAMAPTR